MPNLGQTVQVKPIEGTTDINSPKSVKQIQKTRNSRKNITLSNQQQQAIISPK